MAVFSQEGYSVLQINGTTLTHSSFWKPFQVQYHLSEISYRNFLTNGKRLRIRVEVAPV